MTSFLRITTPIGDMALSVLDGKIIYLKFSDSDEWRDEHCDLSYMVQQSMNLYFSGNLTEFSLPMHFDAPCFSLKALWALQDISYGKTATYADQAEACGNLKATRAVGNVNSSNPIQIIVPCHRVIRKNGEIGHYSGGDWRKKWLLDHEAKSRSLL